MLTGSGTSRIASLLQRFCWRQDFVPASKKQSSPVTHTMSINKSRANMTSPRTNREAVSYISVDVEVEYNVLGIKVELSNI